jgi:hypothetical protein
MMDDTKQRLIQIESGGRPLASYLSGEAIREVLALISDCEQAAELRGKMLGTSFANDAFHDLPAPDLENWLLRQRDEYEQELAQLTQATKPEKEG